MKSPKEIFKNVHDEVTSILKKVESPSRNKDIDGAKISSRKTLDYLRKEISKQAFELDKNSEWDTFTIALYGETNAGKSTIIETLRIILSEKSKMASQVEFREYKTKHGITDDCIDVIQKSISGIESNIQEIRDNITRENNDKIMQINLMQQKILDLRSHARQQKNSLTLIKKILFFFKKTPEEEEAFKLEGLLNELNLIKKTEEDKLKHDIAVLDVQMRQEKNKLESMELSLEGLRKLADGGIIGNGRSDFTMEMQQYFFEINGVKFALLDVPGIEGQETKVLDNIWLAVRKAHAVFYVTGKAAPPQKGDDEKKGTLEKIKEHLGAQTEIWTIFNKRITNPIQLDKSEILNQDEVESLDDLDKKMKEALGQKHKKVLHLSALPAFLAVADHLMPGSQEVKNKSKYLSTKNQQEILMKTKFNEFVELISSDFVVDFKEKIKLSNFNKAVGLVNYAISEITKIQTDIINPLRDQLENETEDAARTINAARISLKTNLRAIIDTELNDFKSCARRIVYAKIQNNLSNEIFKTILNEEIRKGLEKLGLEIPKLFSKELEAMEVKISNSIEKLNLNAKELADSYSKIGGASINSEFELDIKIHSGINVYGIIGVIGGGVAMIWNPAGWVAIIAGVSALLLGFGKAILSFFSKEYKMSQQCKVTDENLERVARDVQDSTNDSLDQGVKDLDDKIDKIIAEIKEPLLEIEDIDHSLRTSIIDLGKYNLKISELGA